MNRCIGLAALSGGLQLSLATAALSGAHAQAVDQNDPAVIATARELAISGVKLAQDGQCAEALPKLERAEKLHHSQIVLTRLGDCYIKLGQFTAGIESLRTVLREPLTESASETLKQAYAEAGNLVEANKPKLAKLTIKVAGVESTTQVALTIDNKSMPSALLGAAHVSDPGEHNVSVSAAGYLPASRKIVLIPGAEESVLLTLEPDLVAQAELQRAQLQAQTSNVSAAPENALSSADTTASSPSHWPAYVTWGASAVALGVGVGFGFAALENRQSLEERCPNKLCPPDAEELLNTSRTNATISTIAYGAGVAGLAVGVLLFWLESSGDDAASGGAHAAAPRVRLAPHGLSVSF
jgi:tetratricopeptide (TPR) repeat protein